MENTNNPVSGSQNSASYKTQTTISEMYFEIFMLYRRQWLTYAFQSVITTGINIHVQEPDWSFFTNWSSPSLQPARVLGHHGRLWNQHHSEYPIINFYYEHVPLYPHGQVIIRTGVELLSPRRGPEGQFFEHIGQSKENQPKEQGFEYEWSFNLSFLCNLKGRSSNNCFPCI